MQIDKCVKKPIPIESVVLTDDNFESVNAWTGGFLVRKKDSVRWTYRMKTMDGMSYAFNAPYRIMKGVNGEFYPCDCEIFDKTYDVIPGYRVASKDALRGEKE